MDNNGPSVIRLVRGPILLIALGTLFILDQFSGYSFWRTWPVLVILFGVLKLLERVGGGRGGHETLMPPGGAS